MKDPSARCCSFVCRSPAIPLRENKTKRSAIVVPPRAINSIMDVLQLELERSLNGKSILLQTQNVQLAIGLFFIFRRCEKVQSAMNHHSACRMASFIKIGSTETIGGASIYWRCREDKSMQRCFFTRFTHRLI